MGDNAKWWAIILSITLWFSMKDIINILPLQKAHKRGATSYFLRIISAQPFDGTSGSSFSMVRKGFTASWVFISGEESLDEGIVGAWDFMGMFLSVEKGPFWMILVIAPCLRRGRPLPWLGQIFRIRTRTESTGYTASGKLLLISVYLSTSIENYKSIINLFNRLSAIIL